MEKSISINHQTFSFRLINNLVLGAEAIELFDSIPLHSSRLHLPFGQIQHTFRNLFGTY